MRFFRRARDSRAPATIVSVETTDQGRSCRVEVRPALAAPFASALRTRLEMLAGAQTFVLYDPRRPDECELDLERLQASGIGAGRGYTSVGSRGRYTLAESSRRLRALDRLAELRRAGQLTNAEYSAERERVLALDTTPGRA